MRYLVGTKKSNEILERKNEFLNKKLRLYHNEYVATLRRKSGRGWLKIATIGNTGVALDFVNILRKLGHKIEVIEQNINED